MIAFDVLGTPAPKGSARAFTNPKTGRAFVAPGGARSTEIKIKAWVTAVRESARDAAPASGAGPTFVQRPLEVVIEFRMMRPMGHWTKRGEVKPSAPVAPMSKPDIDKLVRTTLDAMTGIVFDDDSRIASLRTTKVWATPGSEGASISVQELQR